MKVISHYYEDSIENSGADSGYIDDITWNDLDMDRIYKKMNIANSSVGQESLYKMLRIPSDIKKLKETDRTSDKETRKICRGFSVCFFLHPIKKQENLCRGFSAGLDFQRVYR